MIMTEILPNGDPAPSVKGSTPLTVASMKEAARVEVAGKVTSGTTVEATVREALPNALFRVELTTGQDVIAHVSTELRATIVRVVPGDRVCLELSTYDWGRGRILKRIR